MWNEYDECESLYLCCGAPSADFRLKLAGNCHEHAISPLFFLTWTAAAFQDEPAQGGAMIVNSPVLAPLRKSSPNAMLPISIIIPCYNAAATLARTLDSLSLIHI